MRLAVLRAPRRGEDAGAGVLDARDAARFRPGRRLGAATLLAEGLSVTCRAWPDGVAVTALIFSGLPPDALLLRRLLAAAPGGAPEGARAVEGPGRDAGGFYERPSRLACRASPIWRRCSARRQAAVARELTKRYEELQRGSPRRSSRRTYAEEPAPRGEIGIVVGPPVAGEPDLDDIDARLDALLARLSLRDAVATLAAETGLGRRTLYDRAGAPARYGAMRRHTVRPGPAPPWAARRRGRVGELLCRWHLRAALAGASLPALLALPGGRDRYSPDAAAACSRRSRSSPARISRLSAFALQPRQRRRIARAVEAFLAMRPDLAPLALRSDASGGRTASPAAPFCRAPGAATAEPGRRPNSRLKPLAYLRNRRRRDPASAAAWRATRRARSSGAGDNAGKTPLCRRHHASWRHHDTFVFYDRYCVDPDAVATARGLRRGGDRRRRRGRRRRLRSRARSAAATFSRSMT